MKPCLYFLFLLVLAACTGPERAHEKKLRRANAKGEFILRNHDDFFYLIPPPKCRTREKYPWEKNYIGRFPKITKEFFRCKGKSSNLLHLRQEEAEREVPLFDCNGGLQHTLPVRDGIEFIYPVLIEILNYIQARTEKKVMITCGHRCPAHNSYSDPKPENQTSKHMIGAEVDFYVVGLEEAPETVLELIFRFYKENTRYRGRKEYELFCRDEKRKTDLKIPPFYNKEIYVKQYMRGEGRDLDNQHSYPYLSIQVLFDREKNQRVSYSWSLAHQGFHRN